jgi:spore germination protein GerM
VKDATGIELKRPRQNMFSDEQIKFLGLLAIFIVFLAVFITQALDLADKGRQKATNTVNFLTNSVSSQDSLPDDKATVQTRDTSELIDVQIYVAQKGEGIRLSKVTRQIPKPADKRELVAKLLQQLQTTPDNTSLRATLPEGTELLSLFIKDKTVYLNLNVELVRNGDVPPLESFITLQSITNTITSLPFASKVKFLVAGRERMTLSGHFDLKRLWSFDPTIVYDVSNDTE